MAATVMARTLGSSGGAFPLLRIQSRVRLNAAFHCAAAGTLHSSSNVSGSGGEGRVGAVARGRRLASGAAAAARNDSVSGAPNQQQLLELYAIEERETDPKLEESVLSHVQNLGTYLE